MKLNNLIFQFETRLQHYFMRRFIPAKLQHLIQTRRDVFKKHGEGIYIAILECPDNPGLVPKIISKYCNGITHIITVFYYKKNKSIFSPSQEFLINSSLKKFYDNKSLREKRIKYLVISNSIESGAHCNSLSYYNDRKMVIIKPPCDETHIKLVLNFLCNQIHRPYAWLNMIGRALGNLWRTPGIYDCASETYEAFQAAGIKIADSDYPTPRTIYEYCKRQGWIIYSDISEVLR